MSSSRHNSMSSVGSSLHAPIIGWPLVIVLVSASSTFVEAIVSHSYGSIANYVNSKNETPLWLTGLVAPLPVAAAAFFLQFSMCFLQKHRTFFRYSALVGHLLLCLSNFTSSFVTPPYALYGLTYGVLYSLGALIILGNANLICGEYFPTTHPWHVLGTSLPMLGWPLGAAIGNPLITSLMNAQGVQNAFFILSGINLAFAFMLTPFLKPIDQPFFPSCLVHNKATKGEEIKLVPPGANSIQQSSEDVLKIQELLPKCQEIRSNPSIPLWLLAKFLGSWGWFSLRTNLVAYATKHMKLNLWHASLAMSLYAWCEVVIAVALTIVSNKLRNHLNLVHLFAASLLSVLSLILFFLNSNHIVAFFIVTGLLGFGIQLFMEFTYPASEEVMQLGLFRSYGLTSLFLGVAVLCSPISGGLILDLLSHAPQYFFIAQLVQWLSVAGLHCAAQCVMRHRPRKQVEAIIIEVADSSDSQSADERKK